jgi:2-oxoisovalerate dehydrogenase E2 component (dihydrolipoyl transacylase)
VAAPPPEAEPAFIEPPMPSPVMAFAPVRVVLMPGDEVIDASIVRRQTADAVTRSAYTAPHVTVWMEADMSHVVQVREAHKDRFRAREGVSLTYLPFVISVVVDALREHPRLNSVWDDNRIVLRKAFNIGIAVALEDALVVPVIRNADGLSLTGIARVAGELAAKAREGRLQPDDVQGGTFTINNPGTLGSLFSTPIIVQPQAGMLSMEAVVKRAVVIDDAVAIRPMMNLSLSVDHRNLDGLSAARFLSRVKRGLEEFPVETSL